ncbi:hypothetical protein K3495_g9734 [Podosphaera aphanis]|nr:hypothetical protein K3495_g9734 [Podosphaera aphanis]
MHLNEALISCNSSDLRPNSRSISVSQSADAINARRGRGKDYRGGTPRTEGDFRSRGNRSSPKFDGENETTPAVINRVRRSLLAVKKDYTYYASKSSKVSTLPKI